VRKTHGTTDARLTAVFQVDPDKPVPERLRSGFYWS